MSRSRLRGDSLVAHSKADANGVMEFHALSDHLASVASLASDRARMFGTEDWAFLAGLWHDLGKFRPGFQTYVRLDGEAHVEGRLPTSSDKSHSAAGALHAISAFEQQFGAGGRLAARVLAYVIAGHHAGLADWVADLDNRLLGARGPDSRREYEEAKRVCESAEPSILTLPAGFDLRSELAAIPGIRGGNPLACAFWIRMLFSALVDADFLDTESFMDD